MSDMYLEKILEYVHNLQTTIQNYHDLKILQHAIDNKIKAMQNELKNTYTEGKHEIDDYVLIVQRCKRTIVDFSKAKQYPELQKTIEYTVLKVFKKNVE